jgi:hypothetical protein
MDRIQSPYKECFLSDDLVSPNCSVAIPEGFKASILRFLAFGMLNPVADTVTYPDFTEEKETFKKLR